MVRRRHCAAVGCALYYYYRYPRKLEVKASEKVVELVEPLVPPEE
jgi:hypothetical protein